MTTKEKEEAVLRALTADERAQLRILFARLNAAYLEVEYIASELAEKVAPQQKPYFQGIVDQHKQHREQLAFQKSEVAP